MYNDKWINEHMTIFIMDKFRQTLFENAIKQGITLFKGENLEILVVPIEWALERKLGRVHAANQDWDAEMISQMQLLFLRHLKECKNSHLDLEKIRK